MLRCIDVKYSAVKKNRVAAETDDNSASSNVCEPVWMPLWERFPVGTRTALGNTGHNYRCAPERRGMRRSTRSYSH